MKAQNTRIRTNDKACTGEEGPKKVIMLNISQFELTKMLYTSGLLAECNLTPTAKLFLWGLCSHYNPENETMFPSQQTISKKLGISEKSAQRAVKELKIAGLIDYQTKRVNHYVFGQKFFELVKMSLDGGQNVLCKGGQNVLLTNKNKKNKEQNVFSFKGNLGKNASAQGKRGIYGAKKASQPQKEANKMVPSAEETRKMLDEREKMRNQSCNPMEFDRKEAHDWLLMVPKFWLKRSKLAQFLVEKYNFSEFKEGSENSGIYRKNPETAVDNA